MAGVYKSFIVASLSKNYDPADIKNRLSKLMNKFLLGIKKRSDNVSSKIMINGLKMILNPKINEKLINNIIKILKEPLGTIATALYLTWKKIH